jgi:hypothetical protein
MPEHGPAPLLSNKQQTLCQAPQHAYFTPAEHPCAFDQPLNRTCFTASPTFSTSSAGMPAATTCPDEHPQGINMHPTNP